MILMHVIMIMVDSLYRACIYPRVRLRLEVDVDPRIQELWHRVTMPLTDGQLEEKLIKSGHMQKQEKKVFHLCLISYSDVIMYHYYRVFVCHDK